jgi:hypothetical protein
MPAHLFNHPSFVSTVLLHLQDQPATDDIQVIALGGLNGDGSRFHSTDYWNQQEQCCPGLWELFKYILMSRGESPDHVSTFFNTSSHFIQSLSCSSFLIRPALLKSFSSWLSDIWIYILTDPLVQRHVWVDCKYISYNDNNKRSVEILPGHILLGDWLNAYYFSSRGYTIQTITNDISKRPFPHEDWTNASQQSHDNTCATAPSRLESAIYAVSNESKKNILQG